MEPHRLEEIFFHYLHRIPPESWIRELDLFYLAETSYFMDLSSIQDSFRFRARSLGLKIATLLIDEKGDLQKQLLSPLISFFERPPFFLSPRGEGDLLIYQHLLGCLKALEEDPSVGQWIRKFSSPVCHKRAEEMIRETLWPQPIRSIETFHVRRAALSAWLTVLRQTVGSCFATAPAILFQQKPHLFFKDLYEMLGTGQIKRVVSGQQYAVPLSLASGKMDLEKVLKVRDELSFSPGLIAAFEAANLFPQELPFMKKVEQLHRLLGQFKEEVTAASLIRDLILDAMGLNLKDLEEEERLAKMQMEPLFTRGEAIYYQRPSVRAQKIANWKKACAKANEAFQTLTECSLLRSWEYTLASFCDMKVDFAKWNLYLGLGLQVDQKGGIGEFLYRCIDRHLQECNQNIAQSQQEYEAISFQVYSLQSLLYQSTNDEQRHDMRGELSSATHEMQTILEKRDLLVKKAEVLSQFFSILMNFYDQKLPLYFQEIFDPFISSIETDLYEDSPAGFRLLYKHGRTDASLWTLIYDGDHYIESLRLFFSSVENEIILPAPLEDSLLSKITTELIQFIQEPEFLKESLLRSRSFGRKSPWDYMSGGTMQTLVQAYVERSEPFTEKSCSPRRTEELLHFLLLLKQETKQRVLIHSPTHAFILYLEQLPKEAQEQIRESRNILKEWMLNEEKQEYLAHLLSGNLSQEEKALFLHRFRQQPIAHTTEQFRSHLLESLPKIRGISSSTVDSFLYQHMPVFEKSEIQQALHDLLTPLCTAHLLSLSKMTELIAKEESLLLSSFFLIQRAKAILLQIINAPFSYIDWDREISLRARHLHLRYPHLLLFADTNWSGWFFGFVVNIATDQLELWRLSRTGLQGVPMSEWNIWFSQEAQASWIVLSRPEEYNS